ncbi:flagellar hook-basal body complex protein [Paracoccus versutus]|uniref:Flagellar basal-body rod protein FlgF n=1 Tax=Paracoccus versutus TaxID=34007 RepID=A0AAQ0HEI6_PARVE|nr:MULTISPECIES: flagellar hook-basal body complex protein [Paracoccus]WGR60046.1 flagellar hook-basal body complex protein [Paracoccus ferrooxidans]KGJ03265.1 flagellar basal body rod protein FlgF [Paracoccus versutus]MBT0778290.1 flagellar hook-basal body complex protein [Paracoccus sp. pheM1]REG34911.1 flagellar basal-body rod protein FlgF [Paracoccus versutus]WEJ79069.1 flagellar hook-basal body complex protein [Paracoccus versutus]
MDNAIYAALTRQSGLMREMRTVANNIANANTAGFRREGVVFSEYMVPLDGRGETLAMANGRGRMVDLAPGGMTQTNGQFDLAIDGEGFLMVQTPQGNRLTRAGAFMTNAEGELVNPDGYPLLDDGEAPIVIPAGVGSVGIGIDGTISADGNPIGRIGVFASPDPARLRHTAGTLFDPGGAVEPLDQAVLRQGFLEESNVDPVLEVARMIEVQRAYQLGQSFLDQEDQRIRQTISSLTR